MPGPHPLKDLPSAAGGHLTLPWTARKPGARAKPAVPKPPTSHARNVNILRWSAHGVYDKKKITLAERLQKKNIEVACLQETPERIAAFNITGYQVLTQDRENRTNGRVAILVGDTQSGICY